MISTMTIEKAYEKLEKKDSQYVYSKEVQNEYIAEINEIARSRKKKKSGVMSSSYVEAIKYGSLKTSL